MRLMVGADEAVARLVSRETGDTLANPFRTIGLYHGHEPKAGICLTEYTGASVVISGSGGLIVQRRFRQAICDMVYGYLGCRRLEMKTRRSNKRMKHLARRLGFVYEGRLRLYYGDEDGMIYSLLAHEAVERGHWVPLKEAA